MVAAAKALGGPVEFITNGILLTEQTSRQLIAAGLDRLWVSLDGARPESYADVRLGAALPVVLANVSRFSDSRPPLHPRRPEIGVAFVAMRRTSPICPPDRHEQRARRFALPRNQRAALHSRNAGRGPLQSCPDRYHLSALAVDAPCGPAQDRCGRGTRGLPDHAQPSQHSLGGHTWAMPTTAVPLWMRAPWRSVGTAVSPCLPLLHDHTSYLNDRERNSRRYSVGKLAEHSLADLWYAPEHVAFRRRVRAFDFSPCTFCGGCDYSLANEEDCFGNPFPTCGGCLWAQGVIRCP